MKIFDQKKMIESMQEDFEKIELRQKEINSLIDQINDFNFTQNVKFEENYSYTTAKFESKNDHVILLEDFFNKYSNGDKYISIKDLFSQIIKKDLSQKRFNNILKKDFNGSKNLIKYLEEKKFNKILNILEKINTSNIKKPKMLNAFLTNSKINEKIRITNSVFPSNLEKKANFPITQKKSKIDSPKKKRVFMKKIKKIRYHLQMI